MKEKKKNISLLLALALLLGLLAGCGVKPAEAAGTGENTGESAETVQEAAGINTAESGAAAAAEPAKEGAMTSGMMMGNPWTDCESKEEAEKLAGFKIDTDLSLVEGADSMVYRVLGKDKASAEDRMLEVIWFDAAGEELVRVRKTEGFQNDISGDYNVYTAGLEADYDWGGISASGTGSDSYQKACWNTIEDGKWYSYSMTMEEGKSFCWIDTIVNSMIKDLISKDLAPVPTDLRDPSKATMQPAPFGGTENGEGVPDDGSSYAVDPQTGREFSPRNLLISVTEKFSSEELDAFCEKYGLTVVYDYSSLDLYAMSLAEDHSYEELTALADRITEENEKVLGCELDGISYITDPVTVSF